MSEIVLLIDDLRSADSVFVCRICHEEELQSLESPCACSGTVKFAHRDCVQRWCDEKGNTTCEICLQKFEPGYATPPPKKTERNDTTVTIRESLEVPEDGEEGINSGEVVDNEHSECDKSAAYCRSVALIFTALLLIRHLFEVLIAGPGNYPFSLFTVLIAKASGILLPMYILIHIISALHNTIKHQYEISESDQEWAILT